MVISGPRRLVLIVEDDVALRDTLAELLFDEGYRVHCAADGREALEDVAVEPPDVIVSDIPVSYTHLTLPTKRIV